MFNLKSAKGKHYVTLSIFSLASFLYNAGYRKASEVVEEFAYSLKDFLHDAPVVYQAWFGAKIDRYVEIFKKKYTEDNGNDI